MSATSLVLAFPGLFLCILLFAELGRRIGLWLRAKAVRESASPVTIETAIYALMGLMLAFTFSGAASRFDLRRTQTVQEANAIGTAYLRLDLLPAAEQPALREHFRQ